MLLITSRGFTQKLTRMASTKVPYGYPAILQKNPDDVVITFAKRTAVGRARKGQLKDVPVDEMLCALFKVINCLLHGSVFNIVQGALKETKLDPAKIDDICVGTLSKTSCFVVLIRYELFRDLSSPFSPLHIKSCCSCSRHT